jgi:hypothetical protein
MIPPQAAKPDKGWSQRPGQPGHGIEKEASGEDRAKIEKLVSFRFSDTRCHCTTILPLRRLRGHGRDGFPGPADGGFGQRRPHCQGLEHRRPAEVAFGSTLLDPGQKGQRMVIYLLSGSRDQTLQARAVKVYPKVDAQKK